MKICVYMEGKTYIKTGGVRTAYHNKIKACKYANLEVTTSPKDDFDILQIEFPGPKSLLYIKRAKRRGRRVFISTHITAEDFKDTFFFGKKLFPIVKRYLRFFYSNADALIAPSEYTKKLIEAYGVGKPIFVLSNGIDPDFLKNAKIKKTFSKRPVVGCVGFVTKRKGIITFAKVAEKFPDLDFVWIGDIRRNLLFDVSRLSGISNLTFKGYVEDVREEYEKIDIFLFPSYEENQGIALLEAASYGLPLIVRDIPAYENWLIHGENCMKCKNDNDFIESLGEILRNKKLRERIGSNARKLAEKHSLENIGKDLKKIYENFV